MNQKAKVESEDYILLNQGIKLFSLSQLYQRKIGSIHYSCEMSCANPKCTNPGTKACSSCHIERYCGAECQKIDWKIHRILCKFINNNKKFLDFAVVGDKVQALLHQADLRKGVKRVLPIICGISIW